MATKLSFPRGTSRLFLLRFLRPDGAPEDLSEATFAAHLKRSPFDADAEALVDLSARVSAYDAGAGLATLALFPADTADLDPFESLSWQARAALIDGRTLAHEAHLGPVVFTPLAGDPAFAGPPNAWIEEISNMSSYLRILPDLAGLTGGTSTKLDGLSAATLAAMPNGYQVAVFFDGSISAHYRIRGRNTGETEYAGNAGTATRPGGSVILCDYDAARCWELLEVSKQGLRATWNGETLKWHQLLGTGTGEAVAPALAQEAYAFSLPT